LRAILQVLSGPFAGRKTWLRAGQITEVGRGEGVTFSVPHDATMSRVHFCLECDYSTCRIRDNESSHGTFVNGERVTNRVVKDGDKITAGETDFTIRIEGAGVPTTAKTDTKAKAPVDDGRLGYIEAKKAAEVCGKFELDAAAEPLLTPESTPREFLELLMANKLPMEAIRFLAHGLPKREGVWWLCQAIETVQGDDKLPPRESEAFEAVKKWVLDTSDENRRAAHALGERASYSKPAGLAALTVFMSGDSLAPVDIDPVPPDPLVSSRLLVAALTLTASIKEPKKAQEKYLAFSQLGIEVARGKNRWKE
jgi:pSer/pThr/pTyr-binding forkhead associated (FHA) protein